MRLLPRATDWADLWTPPRRNGVVALACLVGAAAFAAVSLAPLARTILDAGDTSGAAAGAGADRFAADLQIASDRVQGRSMFFVPAPPPPPPPPPPPDSGPPPPPSRYAGPSLIAMVNDEVWFSDGRRLSVGDETGGGDSSLAVLEIRAPWTARLRWKGVEFDVPLFDRSALLHSSDLKEEPKETKTPVKDAKPPEPAKPAETPPLSEPAPPPSDDAPKPGEEPPPPPPSSDAPAPAPQPAPIPVPGSPNRP